MPRPGRPCTRMSAVGDEGVDAHDVARAHAGLRNDGGAITNTARPVPPRPRD